MPFGEISSVTGFLGLDPEGLAVLSPPRWHRARPVDGFQCRRKEVSGERLWGLVKDICQVGMRHAYDFYIYCSRYYVITILCLF